MGSVRHEDGTWTHSLRQSFLNSMQQCPESARANYFNELPDQTTDSQALGTAVHAGIEHALYIKRDTLTIASFDEIVDVAMHELEIQKPWVQTKLTDKRVDDLLHVMLSAWDEHVYPTIKPKLIEWEFDLPFYADDKREIRLTGTGDCVDEDDLPWDWKTGSREYEAWEKQRWAWQPTVYCWADWIERLELATLLATSATHPIGDELVRLDMPERRFRYCVMLHNGSIQTLDVQRNQTHVDWLVTVCLQIAELIESGLEHWPLNDGGWHCHPTWCGKWSSCKGADMTDDWTQTLKAA